TAGLTFIPAAHMFAGHRYSAGADLIHAHDAKAAHWAYIQYLLHRTPYIITRRVPNPLKNGFYAQMVYKKAARVVAISSAIQHYLKDYVEGIEIERIPSAWANWDQNAEAVDGLRERYSGCFVIGHVGALMDRHKGQRYLIVAARHFKERHPQMRFLFLGDGPDEEMLRKMAIGLDNVEFLGFREDVNRYLAIMELFVFPSNYEGMGSTLLDAMAFDVPVIASNVGGIPDIVEEQKTGLLIPPKDPKAIVQAIESLYHDPDCRRRLAANARAQLSNYSPSKMARRYLDLYKTVLR
ncbi:MAG: glycosyltransferase family 4 protein, partial [Desulfobacterales bacterium]